MRSGRLLAALAVSFVIARSGYRAESVRAALRERFGITHVTLQMEREHCDPKGEAVCVPLEKPSA